MKKKKNSFFKAFFCFLCIMFVISGIASMTSQIKGAANNVILEVENNTPPDYIVFKDRVLRF